MIGEWAICPLIRWFSPWTIDQGTVGLGGATGSVLDAKHDLDADIRFDRLLARYACNHREWLRGMGRIQRHATFRRWVDSLRRDAACEQSASYSTRPSPRQQIMSKVP